VVVLQANPPGPSPLDCATKNSSPEDCVSDVRDTASYASAAKAERAGVADGGGEYVETKEWFCVDNLCPIFAGGRTMRWDGIHLTAAYSTWIAPRLRQALAR
jgi:hypothetical protein